VSSDILITKTEMKTKKINLIKTVNKTKTEKSYKLKLKVKLKRSG